MKWTEHYSDQQNQLRELYEENPRAARIKYLANTERYYKNYSNRYSHGEEKVRLRVGISTSLKWFHNQSILEMVFITSKGVWFKSSSLVRPALVDDLGPYMRELVGKFHPPLAALLRTIPVPKKVNDIDWMTSECSVTDLAPLKRSQVNMLLKNKLFTMRKVYCAYYKVKSGKFGKWLATLGYDKREFPKMRRFLVQTNDYNSLLPPQVFKDTFEMAYKLCRSINPIWSVKRMNAEHDKFSQELRGLMSEMDSRPLSIEPRFILLAEQAKLDILTTTGELAVESMMQNHCVGAAGYDAQINQGACAIFHFQGYTVQVNRMLNIIQMRGKHNKAAPDKLMRALKNRIHPCRSMLDFFEGASWAA